MHGRILLALTALTVVACAALLAAGGSYYLAPPARRPFHRLDEMLKPTGLVGHGLGILGGLLVLLTLLYPLRKRRRFMRRFGRTSVWLRYHIWMGLAGPALVTFHTSFKFGGLVAVCYWSMVAVVLSGLAGRYIYGQIPRTMGGDERNAAQAREAIQELRRELSRRLEGYPEAAREVERICSWHGEARGGLRLLRASLAHDFTLLAASWRLRRLLGHEHYKPRKQVKEIIGLARRRALLARRVAVLGATKRVFRHWHSIHKPFTIVLYIVLAIHVVVAVLFGYVWIFG